MENDDVSQQVDCSKRDLHRKRISTGRFWGAGCFESTHGRDSRVCSQSKRKISRITVVLFGDDISQLKDKINPYRPFWGMMDFTSQEQLRTFHDTSFVGKKINAFTISAEFQRLGTT